MACNHRKCTFVYKDIMNDNITRQQIYFDISRTIYIEEYPISMVIQCTSSNLFYVWTLYDHYITYDETILPSYFDLSNILDYQYNLDNNIYNVFIGTKFVIKLQNMTSKRCNPPCLCFVNPST